MAVLLTGASCGQSDSDSSSSAAADSSPSPPGASEVTLELGQSVDVPEPDGTVWIDATVFAYNQPVAKSAYPPVQDGFHWGAADVRVCAKENLGAQIAVSNSSWALVYRDDTMIEASHVSYTSFPEPSFPFGSWPLAAGRCVRGWITFGVPADQEPKFVEYAPAGVRVPPRWSVR